MFTSPPPQPPADRATADLMNEQIAVVRENVNMLADDRKGLTLTLADLGAILRTLGLQPTEADVEVSEPFFFKARCILNCRPAS